MHISSLFWFLCFSGPGADNIFVLSLRLYLMLLPCKNPRHAKLTLPSGEKQHLCNFLLDQAGIISLPFCSGSPNALINTTYIPGQIAESHIIRTLRTLHKTQQWNQTIQKYVENTLQNLLALFSSILANSTRKVLTEEEWLIVARASAALDTLGGSALSPTTGIQVTSGICPSPQVVVRYISDRFGELFQLLTSTSSKHGRLVGINMYLNKGSSLLPNYELSIVNEVEPVKQDSPALFSSLISLFSHDIPDLPTDISMVTVMGT